jgi:hypothetical protein
MFHPTRRVGQGDTSEDIILLCEITHWSIDIQANQLEHETRDVSSDFENDLVIKPCSTERFCFG